MCQIGTNRGLGLIFQADRNICIQKRPKAPTVLPQLVPGQYDHLTSRGALLLSRVIRWFTLQAFPVGNQVKCTKRPEKCLKILKCS